MRLAVIYDPYCPKLTEASYSRTYLDMFEAVVNRFEQVQHVTGSCSPGKIKADVILIYDIHSAFHIELPNIAEHPALKYTYFNDPYQQAVEGVYRDQDIYVCKLGAKRRTQRTIARGVDYIICPYKGLYYKHITPHLNGEGIQLLWFPPAPSIKRFPHRDRPIAQRHHKILANGITWGGDGCYDFRKWAYSQPESFFMQHAAYNRNVTKGAEYGRTLSSFAASLALCDTRIVPKYLEIPLSGCVCFAQDQQDYRDMGFVDGENCVFVTKDNYRNIAQDFLASPTDSIWQTIADAGRKLIEENWTAERFADALYEHAQNHINQTRKDTL